MALILIVEDEQPIAELIGYALQQAGYECDCAFDGKQGADKIEKKQYDLLLLDIMLPEVDGYELLEYALPTGTPVIFITARGSIKDKIRGLRMGADDYIVKPFDPDEMVARVESVLRRYNKSNDLITINDTVIDVNARYVTQNGKVIPLTIKEFDLLVALARNKNIALYRDALFEKVWGEEFTGDTRTLDLTVFRLRKKLNWQNMIKTVVRIGYMLEVNFDSQRNGHKS